MRESSKCYASYLRNSLADQALQGGEFSPDSLVMVASQEWHGGTLTPASALRLFQIADRNLKEKDTPPPTVDVLGYISVFSRIGGHAHGTRTRSGAPGHISTTMMVATINRAGDISSTHRPHTPRSLLDPLEEAQFVIGTIDDFDRFLDANPLDDDSDWNTRLTWAHALESAVVDQKLLCEMGYQRQPKVYLEIIDAKTLGAACALIGLYDRMIEDNPRAGLFDSFASDDFSEASPIPNLAATFSIRTGHAEPTYPLALAQRDALGVALSAREGEIVAVNGPPGTGKTTLLHSVIGSLWVSAAIERAPYPPVIAATSANNQPITNIIDSFGKIKDAPNDRFGGRWLPGIQSYGCYCPALGKDKEAREKGYFLAERLDELETQSYLDKAEAAYLEDARVALGEDLRTTADVIAALHQLLTTGLSTLNSATSTWRAREAAASMLVAELGPTPHAALGARQKAAAARARELAQADSLQKRFETMVADEPLWLALLGILPPVERKRVARARTSLGLDSQSWPAGSIEDLERRIKRNSVNAWKMLDDQTNLVKRAQTLIDHHTAASSAWAALAGDMSMVQFDAAADTRIRQPMFKVATHYWEGRWLEVVREKLRSPVKTSKRNEIEQRWRRTAMITPCVVATVYKLPALFSSPRTIRGKWINDPLYDFIDFLIVDEAGQVPPSVGGAPFALAKRAVVVGDVLQLEPIVTCSTSVDIGTFNACGSKLRYQDAEALGRTVVGGNVMRVAQTACRFHYDQEMTRGMMLYEHRRCVDSIIRYCSELCYQGKLKPMRGSVPHGDSGIPSMGYVHVAGIAQKAGRTSRMNRQEASAVVAFIHERAPALRQAYPGRSLEEIIAVVTPFAEQSRAILSGLASRRIDGITVGTTHRLQGAEFPIVLFSGVYTRHDGQKRMLDDKPNMLNVAVSRAQDAFILVGDMDAFDERGNTPSSRLVAHLMNHGAALTVAGMEALVASTPIPGVTMLKSQQEHDQFLRAGLAKAHNEVVIVSPWISGPVLDFTGLGDQILCATRRGVKVLVYTDQNFNRDGEALRQNAGLALQRLVAAGADVRFARRIHNKDVFVDSNELCRGSFNWLSVFRNSGETEQLDTSLHYAHESVAAEKACMLQLLARRQQQP